MKIACNNNEKKKKLSEFNSIRKGFKPQTVLVRDKEGTIVSNKENVLQGGLNIVRSTLNCKMEQTVAVEKSGQCI